MAGGAGLPEVCGGIYECQVSTREPAGNLRVYSGPMKTNLLAGLLRAVVALGLAVPVVLQTGCLVVAAGAAAAGTVVYVRGELKAALPNSYDAVVNATNQAIDSLRFRKTEEEGDALKTEIEARTGTDKSVEIEVIRVSDSLTNVHIRVGVFGDEAMSLTILEKIKESL